MNSLKRKTMSEKKLVYDTFTKCVNSGSVQEAINIVKKTPKLGVDNKLTIMFDLGRYYQDSLHKLEQEPKDEEE